MPNTILTPDIILRKCLQVLHAKLNFIGKINRQYDSQFASAGGKIGESLRIRLPEKYVVKTGATLQVQDSTEQYTTMTVATQKHVGMKFTTRELTMSIEDFTERKIVPAMSMLASSVEADALSMVLDIYNQVGTEGTVPQTLKVFGDARAKLNQYLAPMDQNRTMLLTSAVSSTLVDKISTLFHDSAEISRQYREGIMGRAMGFTFAENDLLPTLTNGTRVVSAGQVVDVSAGWVDGSTTLKITGGTSAGTILAGEILTLGGAAGNGIYAVHPETKTAYPWLQQFVVTTGTTLSSGGGTISIYPAPTLTGPYQNISVTPVNGTTSVNFVNATYNGSGAASNAISTLIGFHKDAFAFVSADLEMPSGVDFAARKVMDGISMRIIRQYDINNDTIPARIDVFYGYKTIRPELAVRVIGN